MDFILRSDTDDDLSQLKNEAVPDDVRKWLASTFASPDQVHNEMILYFFKKFWQLGKYIFGQIVRPFYDF